MKIVYVYIVALMHLPVFADTQLCTNIAGAVASRIEANTTDAANKGRALEFVNNFCSHTCQECKNSFVPNFYLDTDSTIVNAGSTCKLLNGALDSKKYPCHILNKEAIKTAITLNGEL